MGAFNTHNRDPVGSLLKKVLFLGRCSGKDNRESRTHSSEGANCSAHRLQTTAFCILVSLKGNYINVGTQIK